jgi:hypothetical protein
VTHGDAWEGKRRGNRVEWVSSMPRKTTEHSLPSAVQMLRADPHTSAASSRLNCRLPPSHMESSVSPKDEIWFLRVCHLHYTHFITNGEWILRRWLQVFVETGAELRSCSLFSRLKRVKTSVMRGLRLPPRRIWGLRSYGLLRGAGLLPTFRDNIFSLSWRVSLDPWKMGPIHCPKTGWPLLNLAA